MPKTRMGLCKMGDCSTVTVGCGFCNKHYLQWRAGYLSKHGQRLQEVKERRHYAEGAVCKVEGCSGKPRGRGMCQVHFDRYRQGILNEDGHMIREPQRNKLNPRKSFINNHGYRLLRIYPDKKGPQAYELEHRWVMAQVLGRELTADEVVHHVDGDRLNNSPSNLELLTINEHPPAHEWTPEMVLQALEALRHNDPSGYHLVMSEQDDLTPEREN